MTTDPNAVRAEFTLVPPLGSAPGDTRPTINGESRIFSTTAEGLALNTAYTYVVAFFDAGGNRLRESTGGCGFVTPPAPGAVYLCVSSRWIAEGTATIGARTTDPAAIRAHFILTPAHGIVPDASPPTVNGVGRNFSTTATGLVDGQSYDVIVEFFDASGGVLGTSAHGDCEF